MKSMTTKPHAPSKRKLPVCCLLLLFLLVLVPVTSCNLVDACHSAETCPMETARPGDTTLRVQTTAPPPDCTVPPHEEDWRLTLVNPWNPVDFAMDIPLMQLSNGLWVDERCYPDLQAMMDDCRAAGYQTVIFSSYRSQETQQALFDAKVRELLPRFGTLADAEAEAAMVVARPGTSEHHLGLAMDIVDMGYQLLDEGQEDTPVQQWLIENSWKYGFILRYPLDKSHLTGIIYEPWHYRYVGLEAAREMHARGLCLEEYLSAKQDGTSCAKPTG